MNIISLGPGVHLAPFNIFDVGANKPYVNQGAMDHECRTSLHEELTLLANDMPKDAVLALSGPALEYLREEDSALLKSYQQLHEQGAFRLATQPYHGTSITILDEKEAAASIQRHQTLLAELFGEQARILHTDAPAPKSVLAASNCHDNACNAQSEPCQLQAHVLAELKALAPHVHGTEDHELIDSFHLLANTGIINELDPESGSEPYDHYTSVMSVLHDIAHRIKAAQLIRKGIFTTTPRIGASPSASLR